MAISWVTLYKEGWKTCSVSSSTSLSLPIDAVTKCVMDNTRKWNGVTGTAFPVAW